MRARWTHVAWTCHSTETHVIRDVDVRTHSILIVLIILVVCEHLLRSFLSLVIGVVLAVGGVCCYLRELLATGVPLTAVRRVFEIWLLKIIKTTNDALPHGWLLCWALNMSLSLFAAVGYLRNVC